LIPFLCLGVLGGLRAERRRWSRGIIGREIYLSCAICETRKEKRFCPAIHGRICPQCCGEQREVTLDCPSDCAYLRQARQHERPRPINGLDQAVLFPDVELSRQFLYQQEHLILGLYFALAQSARGNLLVKDVDLIAALSALTRSYETLVNSGLHYESPIRGLIQQAVVAEVQAMVKEYRETEHKQLGSSRLRDADIFRALVFVVRIAFSHTSGRPKSRAFADFVVGQFPEKSSGLAAPAETSSIIIP